jgi:cell division protein ZapA (FtsZ GTPase activity inhibitor)
MIQLDVLIMGQLYRLACREGEQQTLREAVQYLDGKMRCRWPPSSCRSNRRKARCPT